MGRASKVKVHVIFVGNTKMRLLVTASERSERGGLPINVGAGLDPAPFIILGNHKGCPYNIIFRGNRDCFGIITPRNDRVADFFYTHP